MPAATGARRQQRPGLRGQLPVALDPQHLRAGPTIVAQGDQSDLGDTKALADLPGGKYLISVTADGFKIDGQHFTVDGGTHRVDGRAEPDPAAAGHHPDPGLQRQRSRGRHLRGRRRAGALRLHRPPHRRVRRRQHGLLRQPAVHRLPAPQRERDGADRSSTPTSTRSSSSDARPAAASATRRAHRDPEPRSQPATPPPSARRPARPPSGCRPPRSRAATTTTSGARRARPASTTSSSRAASRSPMVQFGFVRTRGLTVPRTNPPTGEVKGVAVAGLPYIGGQNGQAVPRDRLPGRERRRPDQEPWVALSDLGAGDAAIYVGRGDADGTFDIKNVPDGTYQLTLWDDDLDYILWSFNVEVARRRRHRRRQQDDRRLVHPPARPRLRRLQRERQAGPGREVRPAVPADGPRARQLADGPVHEHHVDRRQRRLRHPRDLPARQVAGARGVRHPLPHHRASPTGREREEAGPPSSAAWST